MNKKMDLIKQLRPGEYYVLEILKEIGKPLSPEEISIIADIGIISVYKYLRKLVGLGLVEKEKMKGKRKVYYKIRGEGNE